MRRRICIYCETWESGGIESFLSNILSHMDLTDLDIDIVAAQVKGSVFTSGLQALGIHFIELSGSPRRLWKNHKLFRLILAKKRYDVLHLNIFHGLSLYYAVLAKRAGVPVCIAHSHNTALRKSKGQLIKLSVHKLFSHLFTRAATLLWACSREAASFLFAPGELKKRGFQFIPNGIDTEKFRFRADARELVRQELGLEHRFVLGNVGRLCYQKNQDFLLDVFAEVLRRRPDGALLLVGDGEDLAALIEKTKRLGIADRVIFYGTSDRVEELLWAMDAFAFPSRFEGLGIVAVEAQAAGLAVLCSEAVPEEVNVTSLFHSLPLRAGADQWAETLLDICQASKRNQRELYAAEMGRAGFDIRDTVRMVENAYRGTEG